MIEAIIAIVGVGVGLAIGILMQRGRINALSNEAESLRTESKNLRTESERLRAESERLRAEASDDKVRVADLEATMRTRDENARVLKEQQERHHREEIENMTRRFDETIAKMSEHLRNVTESMLKQRQEEFAKNSSESLSHLLRPLQDNIAAMKESVNANTTKHSELGGQLSANIDNLLKQSEAARLSADRLSNALRNNNRVQGNWGETILTELLEANGLREGIHFDVQSVVVDEKGNAVVNDSGHTMRPDVVLHLDRERDVIIDSKASLTAFLDYVNADNDSDRERFLNEHVASLKRHVKELADKKYQENLGPGKKTVDYVIMFVPSTAALYAATEKCHDLWRKAMEQKVYIADEQTLYAALTIVALTWRQITQADNHRKVYQLADEMLKRVNQFMEKFVGIGKALETATNAYEQSMKKLSDQGQSIPQTCNKLLKLGAKVEKKKSVPDELIGLYDPTDDSAATDTNARPLLTGDTEERIIS